MNSERLVCMMQGWSERLRSLCLKKDAKVRTVSGDRECFKFRRWKNNIHPTPLHSAQQFKVIQLVMGIIVYGYNTLHKLWVKSSFSQIHFA